MISEAKVLIATPAAGGMVTAAYTNFLFNIVSAFRTQRPKTIFELQMSTGTDLHLMRNFFAAKFMKDKSFTHLLFIDADNVGSPRLIAKMLDFEKPFVGSLVPFRSLKAERIDAISSLPFAKGETLSLMLDYVAAEDLIPLSGSAPPQFQIVKGFARTKRIGAGIMLLTRSVFERLEKGFPELLIEGNDFYRGLGHDGSVLQCFSPLQSENGMFFSEDISLCERWRSLSGEIWVCVDEHVSHIGPYAFTGRYVDRMKHGLFQLDSSSPISATPLSAKNVESSIVSPPVVALSAHQHCIWIVSPKGYDHHHAFDELAIALSEGFADRGGSAPIVRQASAWRDRTPIVLGGHLITPNMAQTLPAGTVLYNTEQVSRESSWLNGQYIGLMRRHAVLDYSIRNLAALQQAGIAHARLLPPGYSDGLNRIAPAPVRDIDVLFYGSINERRAAVLDGLRAQGLAVVHLFNVYGGERDAAIARAKLVLNLHFYDSAIFESPRVTYLLANGVCVVTEGDLIDPDIAHYEGGLGVCDYHELIPLCLKLLANEPLRRSLAQKGQALAKQRPQADLLGDLFTSDPQTSTSSTSGA